MTGPTHAIIAASATLAYYEMTNSTPVGFLPWLIIIAGSLFPDIDEPHSTISKPLGIVGKMLPKWLQTMVHAPIQAFSDGISKVFGHRGVTHYLLWPALLGGLGWYQQSQILQWFSWGYLWHLLADWITKLGIPAFGPFYRKNVSFLPKKLRITTGSSAEMFINTVCWLYLFYAIYLRYTR